MSRAATRVSGDRFEMISRLVGPAGSVLDVGCRDRALESQLASGTRYVGVDLGPPADVIASAEERLPFEDHAFEVVVFADVLEHLNDPHGALREGIRVASHGVVIVLPNLYSLLHRLQFARGRPWGKYEFGPVNPVDRHRWVMNFSQAVDFASGVAQESGWELARVHAYDGGFRRRFARAAYALARAVGSEDLWSWAFAGRLEPAASRR